MISDFDRFFLHLPTLDREKDFNLFWDKAITDLKKIPIDPVIEKKDEKSENNNFEIFKTTFYGAGKYKVKGELHIPINLLKPKVIILIHDYNQPYHYPETDLDTDIAYFFLQLRGHELLFKDPQDTTINKKNNNNNKTEKMLPGFIIENILEPENYYVKNLYLDVFRSVDFLRLCDMVNCSSIGIIGKGLGASTAVFAAGSSDRIKSLVLDSPSFCYLELSQNISKSDATNEINSFLSGNQSKKKAVKKNLSYFDSINHTDKINIPVLAAVGLKDTYSPPECVFALFNHLRCEKTIEVYPEEDHSAGGEVQLKKSIQWTKTILLNED